MGKAKKKSRHSGGAGRADPAGKVRSRGLATLFPIVYYLEAKRWPFLYLLSHRQYMGKN